MSGRRLGALRLRHAKRGQPFSLTWCSPMLQFSVSLAQNVWEALGPRLSPPPHACIKMGKQENVTLPRVSVRDVAAEGHVLPQEGAGGPRGADGRPWVTASRRLALHGHGSDPSPHPRLAWSHPHHASASPRIPGVRSLVDSPPPTSHVHPPACVGAQSCDAPWSPPSPLELERTPTREGPAPAPACEGHRVPGGHRPPASPAASCAHADGEAFP